MAFSVPKQLRFLKGYRCPALFDVDLNDVDLEQALQGLYFRVRSRGAVWKLPKREQTVLEYAKLVSQRRHCELSVEHGDLWLADWMRAGVLSIGRKGRRRVGEQIQFVRPLHYLASKAPFRSTLYRRVHHFVYEALRQFRCPPDGRGARQTYLHVLFEKAIGQGVKYGGGPKHDGEYVGAEDLDIEQVLCLLLLENVEPARAAARGHESEPPALPQLSDRMANDLLLFMESYRSLLPARTQIRMWLALISLHLTAYTRTMFDLAPRVVKENRWPAAPDVQVPACYFDFTEEPTGQSVRMACECYRRDLDLISEYLELALRVRLLDEFHRQIVGKRPRELSQPEYLNILLGHQASPELNVWAGLLIRELKQVGAISGEELDAAVDRWRARAGERIAQFAGLIDALHRLQHSTAATNAGKWLRDVAGLNRDYGCLTGSSGAGKRWYTLNRTALAAVVYLAAVATHAEWEENTPAEPRPIRLADFLRFLEQRFGIFVDRPPEWLDSAEGRAAARANLDAFKRRLRQAGFFRAMSDDFTAQYVEVPIGAVRQRRCSSSSVDRAAIPVSRTDA